MDKQKGQSPLLIIVLIALAVSGYFLYSKNNAQNQKKSTSELSNQTSEVSPNEENIGSIEEDEKTGELIYKNSTLNYSIRVPKTWTVKDNLVNGTPGEAILYHIGQYTDSPFTTAGIGISAAKYKSGFKLSYDGDFNQALNEKISSGDGKNVFKIGNLKIAGQNAVQFVQRSLPGDPTTAFYSVKTWMVYKDMNYYFVFFGKEELVKENLKLYNNILSSFEILNQNAIDTTNWKTYTNSKYGYSIKYPDSWTTNESDLNSVNVVDMGKEAKSVRIYVLKADPADLVYLDDIDKYIEDKILTNSNLIEDGSVNINNYSGHKYTFNNSKEEDNYAVYFGIADNQYVLIKEISNKSQFKDYNLEIDQVISTFKLTR